MAVKASKVAEGVAVIGVLNDSAWQKMVSRAEKGAAVQTLLLDIPRAEISN